MFCSQCGNALNLSDKFCVKCGTAVSIPRVHLQPAAAISPQMPHFGSPNAKWWGKATAATPFPEPYEWLSQRNTLLVFGNHLAIVPNAEKRSETADLVTSGAFALVGGLFGAARSIKDKLSNKSTGIDSEQASNLFDAGEFVWCKKTDAEVWEVETKRLLGYPMSSYTALSCTFNSLTGSLRFLFPLDDTQESFMSPVNNLGCRIIIKAKGLTDDEASIAYKNLYKDL